MKLFIDEQAGGGRGHYWKIKSQTNEKKSDTLMRHVQRERPENLSERESWQCNFRRTEKNYYLESKPHITIDEHATVGENV